MQWIVLPSLQTKLRYSSITKGIHMWKLEIPISLLPQSSKNLLFRPPDTQQPSLPLLYWVMLRWVLGRCVGSEGSLGLRSLWPRDFQVFPPALGASLPPLLAAMPKLQQSSLEHLLLSFAKKMDILLVMASLGWAKGCSAQRCHVPT